MSKDDIKAVFKAIREDLNVEVILSKLLENGIIDDDRLIVKPLGSFRRGFKKDLGNVDILEDKGGENSFVHIGINREGLYDMLPEGLFHINTKKSFHIDTEESVKELKIHQEEEKSARKFFLPLEQEFIRNKVLIEQKEQSVAAGFSDSMLIEMFSEFWGLPDLPDKLKINLLYLIPLASVFVGNKDLTEMVYSLVLNEPVSIALVDQDMKYVGQNAGLDEALLGDNFVLDDHQYDGLPNLNISIGPLQDSQHLLDYLNGGHFKVLLEVLEEFFIPLDTNVSIELLLNEKEHHFSLTEESQVGVLSYSTYI